MDRPLLGAKPLPKLIVKIVNFIPRNNGQIIMTQLFVYHRSSFIG